MEVNYNTKNKEAASNWVDEPPSFIFDSLTNDIIAL
jgi:hypothetical protein